MALIDFMTNSGQKLFGGGESAEEKRATALMDFIRKMGFEVADLGIDVKKDVVTVRGKAKDQVTREKVVLAIGNTEGVRRVDDRLEVGTAQPQSVYHTVKAGDTLPGIATQYYQAPSKSPTILEANQPMLKDPEQIYPGQVLRIPLTQAS
jgi:nucleoid-associated protein YgaU